MSTDAPWVPAPESMRCGSCSGPLLLTARRSRPITSCTTCGLVCMGQYDERLDRMDIRHPAVRGSIARASGDAPVVHLP